MWFSKYSLQGGAGRRSDQKIHSKTLHRSASHGIASKPGYHSALLRQKSHTPHWCFALPLSSVLACHWRNSFGGGEGKGSLFPALIFYIIVYCEILPPSSGPISQMWSEYLSNGLNYTYIQSQTREQQHLLEDFYSSDVQT